MIDYPYQLDIAFFIDIKAKRSPNSMEDVPISFDAQVKITDNKKFPDRTQVNLLVKSPEESPLEFSVELVGLFSHLDERAKETNMKYLFVRDRGIFMLWSHVVQLLRTITAQMGMNAVNMSTPQKFGLEELQQVMGVETIETEEAT